MASGAAVAASDIPAFRALLDNGRLGALFTPGDSTAAARAINGLLDDTPRRERLSAAAALDVHRYDWSALAPEIEAVYEKVVRTGAASPAS